MGLDQSFYVKKQDKHSDEYLDIEQSGEILYFRKYYELQNFISELMGGIENAEQVRLQPEDLIKVRNFIAEDKNWRFDLNEEPNTEFRPSAEFFKVLGVLTYFASIEKPLFYIGDW